MSLMQQLQHEIDLAFARDQGRGRNTSWYKGDEFPSLACAQRMGIQPMQLVSVIRQHRGEDHTGTRRVPSHARRTSGEWSGGAAVATAGDGVVMGW